MRQGTAETHPPRSQPSIHPRASPTLPARALSLSLSLRPQEAPFAFYRNVKPWVDTFNIIFPTKGVIQGLSVGNARHVTRAPPLRVSLLFPSPRLPPRTSTSCTSSHFRAFLWHAGDLPQLGLDRRLVATHPRQPRLDE